jgi:hypothetical protein
MANGMLSIPTAIDAANSAGVDSTPLVVIAKLSTRYSDGRFASFTSGIRSR